MEHAFKIRVCAKRNQKGIGGNKLIELVIIGL